MKGYIEIYQVGKAGKKLIYSEDNMIVDGARRHVSDILAFRAPVSAVSSLASGSLDASNFDIKAMTLGPAQGNFRTTDTRFTPIDVLNNSVAGRVYSLLGPVNNSQLDTYTESQLKYDLTNLVHDDWAWEGGPWPHDIVGNPSIDIEDGGTVIRSNNVGDVVTFTKNLGNLSPNSHFKFQINAKSEGPGVSWIEKYDEIRFRVYRKENGPGSKAVQYYNFDTRIFEPILPKGKVIPLTPNRKWYDVDFKTDSTRVDEFLNRGLTPEYSVELVVPAVVDDRFSKISIYNTLLFYSDSNILRNTQFKFRDSDLLNSDFRRRSISASVDRSQLPHARGGGYYNYAGGWWNTGMGTNWDTIPILSSTNMTSDVNNLASVAFISSSVDLLDEPAEGYLSFRSSSREGADESDGSGCFVISKFKVPEALSLWDPDVADGAGDLDKKRIFNLSFWYYGASANPGQLEVNVKNLTRGLYYNFEGDETGTVEGRAHNWVGSEYTGYGPTPVLGEWRYFSKDVNIPKSHRGEDEFVLYLRLNPLTSISANKQFNEVYLKDIRFSMTPAYYNNINTSSSMSYASGGGVDIQFKEVAANGIGGNHDISHLTANVNGLKPPKSYNALIKYSSPSAVTADAFTVSIFNKYHNIEEGDAPTYAVDNEPSGAAFYNLRDSSGLWASSLDGAKVTLKGTAGATVTSSLGPIYGFDTVQREQNPVTLTNPSFFGTAGEDVSGAETLDWKHGLYDDITLQSEGGIPCARVTMPSTATEQRLWQWGSVLDLHSSKKFYRIRFKAKVDATTGTPFFYVMGGKYWGDSLPQLPLYRGHNQETDYPYYKITPTADWVTYEVDFWGFHPSHWDEPGTEWHRGHPTYDEARFGYVFPNDSNNNSRKLYVTDLEVYEAEPVTDFNLRIQQESGTATSATIEEIKIVDSGLVAHTDSLKLTHNIDFLRTSTKADFNNAAWTLTDGWIFDTHQLDRSKVAKLNSSGSETWLEIHSPYNQDSYYSQLIYAIPDIHELGYRTGDKVAFSFDHCENGSVHTKFSWSVQLQSKKTITRPSNPYEPYDFYHTWNVVTGEWDEGLLNNTDEYFWHVGPSSVDWLNWCSDQEDSYKSRTPILPEITNIFDRSQNYDIENVSFKFLISPRISDTPNGISRIDNFRTYNVSAHSDTTGIFPVLPSPFDKTVQPKSLDGSGPDKFGHFLNYIEFSSTAGSALTPEEVLYHGCYLPGGGLNMGASSFGHGASYSNNAFSGVLNGTLNKKSVINSDGFIYENPSLRPDQAITDSSAGFVVSSAQAETVSGMPLGAGGWLDGNGREVKYILSLQADEWKFLDYYYGGIGSIGLWTIDYDETFKKIKGESGLPPLWVSSSGTPYATSLYNLSDPGQNPVFKLFAKKVFFPGGLKLAENTNYDDHLTIIWGIKF